MQADVFKTYTLVIVSVHMNGIVVAKVHKFLSSSSYGDVSVQSFLLVSEITRNGAISPQRVRLEKQE